MILPELALVLGAPRRLGRASRLGMKALEREVAEQVSDLPRIPLEDLLERRLRSLAVRALKVGELHERHSRLCRTPEWRPLGRHGHADDRGRLETDQNLRLRPKRLHEERPTRGDLLLLQVGPDILSDGGLVSAQAGLVRLIDRFDLLVAFSEELLIKLPSRQSLSQSKQMLRCPGSL